MRANESCPDGVLLCPAVFTSCPDGSCASTCGPYNGCPLDTPVMVCHLFHWEEGEVEEIRESEGGVGGEVERRATEVNRKEYIFIPLFQCPDGTCKMSMDMCSAMCNNTNVNNSAILYSCWDGQCRSTCPLVISSFPLLFCFSFKFFWGRFFFCLLLLMFCIATVVRSANCC